jgi:hypothetical protein
MRVFVGATGWSRNAVNVFSADLVRCLRKRGLDAAILLSEESAFPEERNEAELERLADVPIVGLRAGHDSRWGASWVAMVRFLEHQAPCIFVPNGDSRLSTVIPLLSAKVGVARIVHYNFDHPEDECDKVLLVKDRMWNPASRRPGGVLGRLTAFARLSLTSQKPLS